MWAVLLNIFLTWFYSPLYCVSHININGNGISISMGWHMRNLWHNSLALFSFNDQRTDCGIFAFVGQIQMKINGRIFTVPNTFSGNWAYRWWISFWEKSWTKNFIFQEEICWGIFYLFFSPMIYLLLPNPRKNSYLKQTKLMEW